jgi:cytochrome oxidase Cu insertion factor (SCO1/SenC/PrrC family)/thiol-disulfide isomerase/thioredoxin
VKTAARPASGSTVESEVAVIVLAALAATGLVLLARRGLARRQRRPLRFRVLLRRPRAGSVLAAGGTAAVALVVASVVIGSPSAAQSQALLTNPNLDPGTNVSRTAPGFTLTDQFGQPVSLRSFRGKVVLLAFTDSECTTICPLTTNAMLEAKRMLGAAGKQVELLGIDANPKSTALQDVLSYSQLHGLLHDWHFLTGSLPQLEQVWKAYGIQAAIRAGEITHTPALYVIDPRGRLVKLYLTQPSYAAIDQQGQVLAQEASRLLPDHPVVRARYGYTEIRGITPSAKVTLPRFSGGSVRLGPGSAHLYLFFATWDREITSLAGQLEALDGYNRDVAASRLPALTAIDEGSIEPSASALGQFIKTLPRPLTYPLAIDSSGRVADGYEVQGEPWFVLTSPSGRIVWYWQVSTSGWLGTRALKAHVRAALASVPKAPAGTVAVQQALTGSPPPLAALHQQSSRLIGNGSGLLDRVKALRGFPIVINAWASWCTPCQEEFGLFATASAQYGRQVAFLGADTADSSGSAEAFLAKHKVSYPSYPTSMSGLDPLVPQGLAGLPTTIFLNRAGKLAYVHIGQYQSEGALYADIREYAIGS